MENYGVLSHYQIVHQRVLIQIDLYLPDNRARLKKINWVGKKNIEKYGDDILELVADYRNKNGIDRGNYRREK